MIHQLLSITRPLIVLDTETTGTDVQKDRIVEVGFQVWTADGMTKEWRSIVNPGVPIPASATKVHGITDERVQSCGACGYFQSAHPVAQSDITMKPCDEFKPTPYFKQLAANLAKGFADCDYAGKNVRFDLRIVAAEMVCADVAWSYAGARIIDAERLEQLAVPRSLSHLHEKYTGLKHDGAHGALSDVRAAATVIAHQLQAHQTLPRDLDTLHEAQWPGWLCDGGQFKMVNSVAMCTFGKWRDKPMRSISLAYWDWLIRSDFPADVKALAADAKLGKFPEAT